MIYIILAPSWAAKDFLGEVENDLTTGTVRGLGWIFLPKTSVIDIQEKQKKTKLIAVAIFCHGEFLWEGGQYDSPPAPGRVKVIPDPLDFMPEISDP